MNSIKPAAQVAFQASATGRVKAWNADCQNILGYAGTDVLHRSVSHMLRPSERNEFKDWLAAYRRDSGRFRAGLLHANGHVLDLQLTLAPQFRIRGDFACFNIILDAVDETASMPKPAIPLQAHFQKLLDCLEGTFYVLDRTGHYVLWNKKLENVVQRTADEIKASHAYQFFHAHDRPLVAQKIEEVFAQGKAFIEADLIGKDGTVTPYLFSGARIQIDGAPYLCGMGLDMSKQKAQEEMLRLSNSALLSSFNGIVITRNEGRDNPIVYINPAFERISGYPASEVIGRDSRFMAAPGLDETERGKIRRAIDERKETHVIFRNLRKDGELFWNELTIAPVQNKRGDVTHFVGVINDVTESKQRAFHLEHEANHDALTGLANRNLFRDRLEQAIYLAKRNKALVAIVFIDLDGFKSINDMEGHEAGDEVLRAVSNRLKASVRESDTVARMGGDEFVLILVNQPSLRFTLRMIERLRQSITEPILAGSKQLNVGASIGVSMYPHDGSSGDVLLQAADTAMYHAKALGNHTAQFFSPEMKSTIEAKQELETGLRNALDNNELFLVFQPRVCLATTRIIGAEALLRWRHPSRGVLKPASFMPLAEESGLILPLGEWVLANACAMLRQFKAQGLHGFAMSLNVSLKEFSRPAYVAMTEQILGIYGIAPGRLEIGITEDSLMHNPQYSINTLAELDQLGVKLAIDNFGAGFSSLSYLQKFPVSHLEIDRSFIADVAMEGADAMITKTVITMGHNLDIDVVAKGVETSSQLNFLKRNQCDQIQGNYFSCPVYSANLAHLLKTNATLRY